MGHLDYEDIIISILTHSKYEFDKIKISEGRKLIGLNTSGHKTSVFDKKIEDTIIGRIRKLIDPALIISEEAGIIGNQSSKISVLLDPLDGSTNAGRGLPIFSTSIAIAAGHYYQDIVAAGVINLITGETITASINEGCKYQKKIVKPSPKIKLNESVVCINLVSKHASKQDSNILGKLITNIRYPRCFGTAALESAYVAIGHVDGYVAPFRYLRTYDCLPSIFMIQEAGGFTHMFDQILADIDLTRNSYLGFISAGSAGLLNNLKNLFIGEV